jgi:tRNA A-37 threonylcarbamoyl transferase component Bud32
VTTRSRGSADTEDGPNAPTIIGEVIDGRYKIVELIGTGGMGRVYRAEQLRLHRSVAVKVLHRSYSATLEGQRRFEREAIAVARLDHPNCVAVQDFGQLTDGSLYLVMSYLPGVLLGDALEDTTFSTPRALHIARHLLSGLAHAHKVGIVHRDVKPDNVMLVHHEGDADFAKLFDFGIVKFAAATGEAAQKLTMIGQRFGTPAYMSPEQSLGRAVDARADLYSLTVVLYEMLIGRRPFIAADEEGLLVMHAAKAPPSLADGAPEREFAESLEALVRRGLSKKPEERYASADEYLAALDDCAAALATAAKGSPSAANPATPTRSRLPQAKLVLSRALRSRRALAVVGGVLLLAGAAYGLHRALQPHHAAHARALLAGGRPQEAAAYLQERLKDLADDPQAQLELGHAYAAIRRYDEALVAYERVRSLDRSFVDDRAMRTNLMLMLDDERNETATGAARFLIQLLDDSGARARVVELASRQGSPAHRAAMRELAESLGLSARVDLVTSYRLDLEQGATCIDRQRAVAQLRALRDPSASASLKRARARKNNGCLRDEAADAIRYLDSLGATDSPAE